MASPPSSGAMPVHPPLFSMEGIRVFEEPLGPEPEPIFNHARHVMYWLRCARTFLPQPYTSSDGSRMLLAFFIVSALDLLGLLDENEDGGVGARGMKVTTEEKKGWIDWIYHTQHSEGGFRGFTGTMVAVSSGHPAVATNLSELNLSQSEQENEWDTANLAATFFALCSLLILGDDLGRVNREKTLKSLQCLQRQDGSFGEVIGRDGKIEGGRDLRFCCCAAGIRRILRGRARRKEIPEILEVDDFNMKGMMRYIESCQTYEGGFSEGPFAEAHSGLTYCAIGALSFLNIIPSELKQPVDGSKIDLLACMKWMLHRQTTYIEEEQEDYDDQDETGQDQDDEDSPSTNGRGVLINPLEISPIDGSLVESDLMHAGFNGRTNKVADTCYAFWNVGALAILGQTSLVDSSSLRRYLLGRVQHMVGGFSKAVGEPPDVLHAYLGLATLSLLGQDGVKPIDPTLCMSKDAYQRLENLSG